MKIFRTRKEFENWRSEAEGPCVGFVPTMGALHEGHASLLKKAKVKCNQIVLSILVNPTQFGNTQDLETYPNTLEADLALAKSVGVDVVIAPTAEDMYGGKPEAKPIDWGAITSEFEGAHRPGHFDGVVAIVDILLSVVKPDLAFFGEKDLQQVAVVRRLAAEKHPGVEIVSCELIREVSGLALSSRNTRLSERGVEVALELSRALNKAKQSGIATGRAMLENHPEIELEYFEGVNEISFESNDVHENYTHIVVAAEVEGVRLIDNIRL